MERLDSERRRFETPNLHPSNVEQISRELEDQLEWDEVRRKVQAKIRAKEELSRDDGTNERAEWKRLGIFLITERKLEEPICQILRQNGVDLYEDETVIELHLPPQNLSIGEVRNSLARLCEYLQALQTEDRPPIYIYGISYLSKFAKRYGFEVAELPDRIRRTSGAAKLLNDYQSSNDKRIRNIAERYQTEDIQICYKSVDDFIDEVSSDEQYGARLNRYHTTRRPKTMEKTKPRNILDTALGEGRLLTDEELAGLDHETTLILMRVISVHHMGGAQHELASNIFYQLSARADEHATARHLRLAQKNGEVMGKILAVRQALGRREHLDLTEGSAEDLRATLLYLGQEKASTQVELFNAIVEAFEVTLNENNMIVEKDEKLLALIEKAGDLITTVRFQSATKNALEPGLEEKFKASLKTLQRLSGREENLLLEGSELSQET